MARTKGNNNSRTARRRRGHNYGKNTTYSRQIHKLLKCICPDLSISVVAMNIMNSFVEDLLDRIGTEASKLVHYSKKSTMGSNDIISAAKLVISTSELRQHAIHAAKRTIEYTSEAGNK